MAYTAIDDPSAHFQSTIYTGSGSDDLVVTNVGNSDLQPDFIWIKKRSASGQHVLSDTSRGILKVLNSNGNTAEDSNSEGEMIKSVQSDGFTLGDSQAGQGDTNYTSGGTYVAWQWKANGGSTTTNDASATGVGSVDSVYQANTTSGFSIVTYTGTGSGDITLAHGLGKVPNLIIGKVRNQSYDWRVYHSSEGASKTLAIDGAYAAAANNAWGGTTPTSTVFTAGRGSDENMNYGSGDTIVAYCFAEIQGYSKFGGYTGNGDTDGTFVYTGFKPAWLMVKRTDDAGEWSIYDTARKTFNVGDLRLNAETTAAEDTHAVNYHDILSNGFKMRNTDAARNGSGNTFIYAAFAEQPFVTSGGVPCTAR